MAIGCVKNGFSKKISAHLILLSLDMTQHDISSGGNETERKKVVVVGLGMVGLAFVEKLIHKDSKRGEYQVLILGEEKHVAYNRVGLTTFFCISIPLALR
jgi:hypothetical protein